MAQDLIEQAVNCMHAAWPACLRAIPDFTDDYINGRNEYKLAVPGYSQLDPYSCGATAGWAVVRTFHPTGASFRKFYGDCDPQPFEGTTETKLVRALHNNGVFVRRSSLNYQSIRAAIESGFPVITTVGHEHSDGAHWVVIYGIGWRPRRVFLCNQVNCGWPGFSRDELTWEDFRSLWNPRGRGLVCWGKRLAR